MTINTANGRIRLRIVLKNSLAELSVALKASALGGDGRAKEEEGGRTKRIMMIHGEESMACTSFNRGRSLLSLANDGFLSRKVCRL